MKQKLYMNFILIIIFSIVASQIITIHLLNNEDRQNTTKKTEEINRLMDQGFNFKDDSINNNYFDESSDENNPTTNGYTSSNPFMQKPFQKYNGPPNMTNNIIINQLNITNNQNFTDTAQYYGWQGIGKNFDPIIIENYNITSANLENYRILIRNVSLHFIIRNCFINNSQNNIYFENVSNGRIIGNTISYANSGFGIFFDDCCYNDTIVYNIFNNSAQGDNAWCANSSNVFLYNYCDNQTGTHDSDNYGIYTTIYEIGGSICNDSSPRIFKQYWNHKAVPDLIWDNNNLDDFIQKEGFLGNGSMENPYIISNINITYNGYGEIYAFKLENTTRCIRFENCFIRSENPIGSGHSPGFGFDVGTSNISLNDIIIVNCSWGIAINPSWTYSSSNINLTNIIFENCSFSAISITDSKLMNFINVTINYPFLDGFNILNSDNLTFEECTVNNSIRGNGFYFENTNNTIFSGCSVENSSSYGFNFILGCENTTISNSSVFANHNTGINIEDYDIKTTIENSKIFNNSGRGIFLENSANTMITNSNITGNLYGIYFYYYANDTVIDYCNIVNNSYDGLIFVFTTYNSIINNSNIINNGDNGISFSTGSESCIVDSTNISYHSLGIMLRNTYNFTIKRVTITNCTSTGIVIQSWSGVSYGHTFSMLNIQNCSIGIHEVVGSGITGPVVNTSFVFVNISYCDVGINFDSYQRDYPILKRNISFIKVHNCDKGIILLNVDYSNLEHCSIHGNNYGMYFGNTSYSYSFCDNNTINYNNISFNSKEGIFIELGMGNNFTSNTITSNDLTGSNIGVKLENDASNNTLINNSFHNNDAWDNGSDTHWNNTQFGNYWSSYIGVDNNDDGIGDTPYIVPGPAGGVDYKPLVFASPTIILLSPANNSIINSAVPIVIQIIGNNGSCIYNWDTGQNNTRDVSEVINLPLTDGIHSLEIFAYSSTGFCQYQYLEFTVDNTVPIIQPYDVENNAEVGNGTWIPFNVNDTHYELFWYYWVDSDGQRTETSITNVPGTWAPSTPGNWELYAFANDTAGNEASLTLNLEILQAVSLNLIYPNGGETVTGFCYIMWETEEGIQVDISYSPDGGLTWIVITTDVTTTTIVWDTTILNNGTEYLVRVVSTTSGRPGEDHSINVFTIYNDPLPPGTTFYSLTNTTIIITLSEPTEVTIERWFDVPSEMHNNPDFYFNTGLFINITLENTDALVSMNISFSYADIENELISQGINISELAVYFWNETSNQWELADDVVIDYENKIIMGYFDHTTVIGVLGRSKASNRGINPLFLIILAIATMIAVIGGGFFIYYYRNNIFKGDSSLSESLRKLFEQQKIKFQRKK